MAAALVLVVVACGGETSSGFSSTSTRLAAPVTTAAAPSTTEVDPNLLEGFERTSIRIGDDTWTVAVADTGVLRGQGLMRVDELLDVDGMLFSWTEEISASFFMLTVPIPLEIAFFDSNGTLVDRFTMDPCPDDLVEPCPTYPAAAPFQYAIETTVGGFAGIDLVLDVSTVPSTD